MQLPIIECGARDAPFIRSEEIASDKLYYQLKWLDSRIGCRAVLGFGGMWNGKSGTGKGMGSCFPGREPGHTG